MCGALQTNPRHVALTSLAYLVPQGLHRLVEEKVIERRIGARVPVQTALSSDPGSASDQRGDLGNLIAQCVSHLA